MPAILQLLLQTALPEIIKYGPAAIEALISIFSSKTAPTQAQWDALLQSTQITARQQMISVLQAHGIDPNSDQGKALIALTPA